MSGWQLLGYLVIALVLFLWWEKAREDGGDD